MFSVDDPAFSTDEFRMFRVRPGDDKERERKIVEKSGGGGGGAFRDSCSLSLHPFASPFRRARGSLPQFSGASPSSA